MLEFVICDDEDKMRNILNQLITKTIQELNVILYHLVIMIINLKNMFLIIRRMLYIF